MFLEIHDLKKSFGSGNNRTEVLKGIEFTANKGEICVLLGPSGSGKSTLLNIIGGIDSPDDGYVAIEGEKMKDMTEKDIPPDWQERIFPWEADVWQLPTALIR